MLLQSLNKNNPGIQFRAVKFQDGEILYAKQVKVEFCKLEELPEGTNYAFLEIPFYQFKESTFEVLKPPTRTRPALKLDGSYSFLTPDKKPYKLYRQRKVLMKQNQTKKDPTPVLHTRLCINPTKVLLTSPLPLSQLKTELSKRWSCPNLTLGLRH